MPRLIRLRIDHREWRRIRHLRSADTRLGLLGGDLRLEASSGHEHRLGKGVCDPKGTGSFGMLRVFVPELGGEDQGVAPGD